jgi:DNA-binding NarL/FixJ family response regulator
MTLTTSHAIDAATDVLVFALAKAIPERFYPAATEEESREAAESIVRKMQAPGEGAEEQWRRNFWALFAQSLLTERCQRVPQSVPMHVDTDDSARGLKGREAEIRKMIARGYTYRRIAERFQVSEQAVQRYVKGHRLFIK